MIYIHLNEASTLLWNVDRNGVSGSAFCVALMVEEGWWIQM